MTIHQRRRLLRRIDLFLCRLFGLDPGPDPDASNGFDTTTAAGSTPGRRSARVAAARDRAQPAPEGMSRTTGPGRRPGQRLRRVATGGAPGGANKGEGRQDSDAKGVPTGSPGSQWLPRSAKWVFN